MIEPRVSVPIANATSPADVAAPGPADDPLELVSGAHGLRVEPPNQMPPCASAPIDSFAHSTAPASRSRSTIVASTSGTRCSNGLRAPRRPDAFGVEQILHAARDAVQWSAIVPGLDFLVGARGLRERELFGERDDAVQRIAVPLQAGEIHPGEIGRAHLPAFDQRREHGDRLEREILEVRRDRHVRRTSDRSASRCASSGLSAPCPAALDESRSAGSVSIGTSSLRSSS